MTSSPLSALRRAPVSDRAREAKARRDRFRAEVVDPDHAPFEPAAVFFGKSPFEVAIFGARREDLGDGPFVYEPDLALEDLKTLMDRVEDAPEGERAQRQYRDALAILDAAKS